MPRFEPVARAATIVAGWAAAAALLFVLAVPLAALILRTVDERAELTEDSARTLRQALTLSLMTSFATLAIIVALGTPLAYILARRRFPGASLVDTLIDLPMVLPPAVAGVALFATFGRRGLLGDELADLGITLPFTTAAVIVAQVFVATPFYVRSGKAGFARVDRDLERAAAGLGASPARVFRSVTFPMARASLVAGAVIAWARALGEFGATIMFAGNLQGRTQTMPLAIYSRMAAGDLETALLLAVVLLAASVVILLGARLTIRPGGEWLPWRMPGETNGRSRDVERDR